MEKYFLFLKKPFSFKGRFNKMQYLISLFITILFFFISIFVSELLGFGLNAIMLVLILIPHALFLIASGTKRSHDIGDSGILQIALPIYIWILLFKNSEKVDNIYGAYIFSEIKVRDNKNNIETLVSEICPNCKNPNTQNLRICEWCGNQIL
jgi:uncharacterized membrane protein YhaH (DUF805 family)